MRTFPIFRPRLLENYLSREFLKLLGMTLGAFLAIFLIVDFFEKIDKLTRAALGAGHLSLYLALKIPFALGWVLPIALLLAVILTFGLLGGSQEIMAIKTAGLDIVQVARPILTVGILAGGVLLFCNAFVIPWSQARLNSFWETQVLKKPARSLVNLEQFWYKGDQAIFNILLFRKDLQVLEGVRIYFFNRDFHLTQVISAKKAQWQGNFWRLSQGFLQNFPPTEGDSRRKFQEFDLVLTERPEDFRALEKKVSEMNLIELTNMIRRLERDNYKSTSYRVEKQNRLSQGLIPIILTLMGLGLALRQEKIYLSATVALALVLLFGYWLLMGFGTSLAQADRWPVFWAVWLPHGAMVVLAFFLLRQARR